MRPTAVVCIVLCASSWLPLEARPATLDDFQQGQGRFNPFWQTVGKNNAKITHQTLHDDNEFTVAIGTKNRGNKSDRNFEPVVDAKPSHNRNLEILYENSRPETNIVMQYGSHEQLGSGLKYFQPLSSLDQYSVNILSLPIPEPAGNSKWSSQTVKDLEKSEDTIETSEQQSDVLRDLDDVVTSKDDVKNNFELKKSNRVSEFGSRNAFVDPVLGKYLPFDFSLKSEEKANYVSSSPSIGTPSATSNKTPTLQNIPPSNPYELDFTKKFDGFLYDITGRAYKTVDASETSGKVLEARGNIHTFVSINRAYASPEDYIRIPKGPSHDQLGPHLNFKEGSNVEEADQLFKQNKSSISNEQDLVERKDENSDSKELENVESSKSKSE